VLGGVCWVVGLPRLLAVDFTGDDVTECVGGSAGLAVQPLGDRYERVRPALNREHRWSAFRVGGAEKGCLDPRAGPLALGERLCNSNPSPGSGRSPLEGAGNLCAVGEQPVVSTWTSGSPTTRHSKQCPGLVVEHDEHAPVHVRPSRVRNKRATALYQPLRIFGC